MVSSYTTNKSIEKPASGDYVNTWATPVNADWDIIDKAFGGITTLNVTAVSGTVVLISAQYQPLILSVTGTLTANVNYQIPSTVGGQWIVANKTTGAYTVTISSGGGGTSVVVPQGYNTVVASDGTNIALANSAPVTAAGSNTQIQYNSSGYLGASANLTFDGTTFAVTGAATVSTTLGVTGAATLSSTLAVTGAITGSGTVTGTALIPSGSSVPANGVYLPAANTVGVASNTTERLRIDSTGAWGLAGTNYGTSGQVLTSAGSGAPPTWSNALLGVNVQTFTTAGSNTWTKPSGYAAGSRVFIQAWGAGGSGSRGNSGIGGGGGGYNERWLLLSDMGATETITVGTGGAGRTTIGTGNNGTNTTVGSLLTAYAGSGGGGGGGQLSAGSGSTAGLPHIIAVANNSGTTWVFVRQGDIGRLDADGSTYLAAPDAFQHGGGGAGSSDVNQIAGNSFWGGGGGGSSGNTTAGTSKNGGNGGAGGYYTNGTDGSQPGGGGGATYSGTTSGKGGDGKVVITVFPA
jgi:hypothetical protein